MAQIDQYGPLIERELTKAARRGKGVSTAELVTKLGCTEGRVRQWIKRNQWRVRDTGLNDYKARLWVLDVHAEEANGRGGRGGSGVGVLPAIRVGGELHVAAIRESSAGRIVVEVVVDGELLLVTIEPARAHKGGVAA